MDVRERHGNVSELLVSVKLKTALSVLKDLDRTETAECECDVFEFTL
jgi:hypothetical protein